MMGKMLGSSGTDLLKTAGDIMDNPEKAKEIV